ncbi:MAG TPA: D-alanyl-D-alanine carboxypeptidase [Pyrinomonadaceae bacterium]|jgi:D-alanyl-D-alanine carboxypeptidase/D-alanyl-D-alanine-endopeptidase (penicillin-binding protein 4)
MIKKAIERSATLAVGLLLFLSLTPTTALQAQQQTPEQQAPTTYTRPTVMSRPAPATTTVQPGDLAVAPDITRPDYEAPTTRMQGVLVETLDGQKVLEQSADVPFNPASAVKLATAFNALRNFGPGHRFSTGVWTTGTLDTATGTLNGDLIISGRDPSLHYEHAILMAHELNQLGIRIVTGDLVVAPRFTMNFDWSTQRSGDVLYDTLDSSRRPAAAVRAWNEERAVFADYANFPTVPSVAVMGAVYVDSVPQGARLLLDHRSSKLVDILKVLLCYSNNFMAERLGDNMGGAIGVEQFLRQTLKLNPAEVRLASTSGLGVNRVTPRAMMKILRALRDELAKHKLTFSDIMPVAGIDPGTLEKRYTFGRSRGSVVAKTGTLVRTDGGASALVGQMRTASGEALLFVIFNMRGNVMRFREMQDQLVAQMQNSRGGPAPFNYRPLTLSMRLADTQLRSSSPAGKDEYEPGTN